MCAHPHPHTPTLTHPLPSNQGRAACRAPYDRGWAPTFSGCTNRVVHLPALAPSKNATPLGCPISTGGCWEWRGGLLWRHSPLPITVAPHAMRRGAILQVATKGLSVRGTYPLCLPQKTPCVYQKKNPLLYQPPPKITKNPIFVQKNLHFCTTPPQNSYPPVFLPENPPPEKKIYHKKPQILPDKTQYYQKTPRPTISSTPPLPMLTPARFLPTAPHSSEKNPHT